MSFVTGIKRGHVFIETTSIDAIIANCPVDNKNYEVRKDRKGKLRCQGCNVEVPYAETLPRGHQ